MAMDHETNHSDVSESDNGQDSSTGGNGAINLSAVRPASAPTTESPTNSRSPTKTSSSLSGIARVNGDNIDSSDQQVSVSYISYIKRNEHLVLQISFVDLGLTFCIYNYIFIIGYIFQKSADFTVGYIYLIEMI